MFRGCMLTGVPNFTFSFGYLKAGAWTMKSDLTSIYACRLLNHMASKGLRFCRPVRDPAVPETPMHSFSSGYLKRAEKSLPKTGAIAPWDRPESYYVDCW